MAMKQEETITAAVAPISSFLDAATKAAMLTSWEMRERGVLRFMLPPCQTSEEEAWRNALVEKALCRQRLEVGAAYEMATPKNK